MDTKDYEEVMSSTSGEPWGMWTPAHQPGKRLTKAWVQQPLLIFQRRDLL